MAKRSSKKTAAGDRLIGRTPTGRLAVGVPAKEMRSLGVPRSKALKLKRTPVPRNRQLVIELDREADGRWIADVVALPGAMAYGPTKPDAIARATALALRVLAERLEHGERVPPLAALFRAAGDDPA